MARGKREQDRIIAAVKAWQASPHVHPLTCGKDSSHAKLTPQVSDGAVILVCPDCDYRQVTIPEAVTSTTIPAVDLDFTETVTRLLKLKPHK
jgi:hypothetical protein